MPVHQRSSSTAWVARRPARVWRRGAVAAALVVATALVTAGAPGSAAADPTTPGSATSKAAEAVAGSGITIGANSAPAISTSGLGSLLSVANLNLVNNLGAAVTSNIVKPLSAALTQLPSNLLTSLTNSITNAGLRADSPSTQQPRPTGGSFPVCDQQGWTSGVGGDCYSGVPVLGAPSLLSVSSGAAQGYATGDDQGYIAAAHVADPTLSVLGIGLGDLGVVDSTASCALTTASCSATQTLAASKTLLGGHLSLSIANGAMLATVDGKSVMGGSGTVTLAPGLTATVSATGNLATIAIGLSTAQLLTSLGIPTLLSALGNTIGAIADTSGSTAATLTIKIGPGSVSQTSPASAWGLNVSADLAVDFKLNVGLSLPKLLGGTVDVVQPVEVATVPASTPNLATLKLAYSTATAGLLLPGWLAPALI